MTIDWPLLAALIQSSLKIMWNTIFGKVFFMSPKNSVDSAFLFFILPRQILKNINMSRQKPQHLRTAKANSECYCARACFLTRSLKVSNFFRLLYKCFCVNFAKFLRTQFFWPNNSWPLLLNCINVGLAIISKNCTNTVIQGEGCHPSCVCMHLHYLFHVFDIMFVLWCLVSFVYI